MTKPLIVAIDGPAASGKGTVARMIAKHFNLKYLDTGSIYRAVAYSIILAGGDYNNAETAISFAKNLKVEDLANPNLYDEGVGRAASVISAIPEVRNILLQMQRSVANSEQGAVLDGRDIGTVICPDANFKFFITASLPQRAERRYKELQNRGCSVSYTATLEDLERRDKRDSQREICPLAQAEDAILIDSTSMAVEQVFKKIIRIIDE